MIELIEGDFSCDVDFRSWNVGIFSKSRPWVAELLKNFILVANVWVTNEETSEIQLKAPPEIRAESIWRKVGREIISLASL